MSVCCSRFLFGLKRPSGVHGKCLLRRGPEVFEGAPLSVGQFRQETKA